MANFTNLGIDQVSKIALGTMAQPTWTAGLFTSNTAINCNTAYLDPTYCSLPGYSDVDLVPANWTITTVACVTTATYPKITFTFTSGDGVTQIMGYVVADDVGQIIIWGDLFATPFTVPAAGGSLDLFLTYGDQQCS